MTFQSLTAPKTTTVLEQNFEYDLASSEKLLQKHLGREVTVTLNHSQGTIQRSKSSSFRRSSSERREEGFLYCEVQLVGGYRGSTGFDFSGIEFRFWLAENNSVIVREAPSSIAPSKRRIPPLVNGDHMSRDEFERRYEAMPEVKKAELIEGVVYTAPRALRWDSHARPDGIIAGWLMHYEAHTPGVQMGHNASIRLDMENEPQPDLALIVDPQLGGQAHISADDYVEGAPELVVEISSSTTSIDLNAKFRAYRRNSVLEYIVWRVLDREIDWFALRGTEYVRLTPDRRKILKSEVFPGLWLDTKAALQLDSATLLRVLDRGTSSKDHAGFVSKLESRIGRR